MQTQYRKGSPENDIDVDSRAGRMRDHTSFQPIKRSSAIGAIAGIEAAERPAALIAITRTSADTGKSPNGSIDVFRATDCDALTRSRLTHLAGLPVRQARCSE